VLLPCELIDQNGPALKKAVLHFARLWNLTPAFDAWIEAACTFCSTLVDRIVTGYPSGGRGGDPAGPRLPATSSWWRPSTTTCS
jgi:mannitol-1-phosphate/altronate dehydrogenase